MCDWKDYFSLLELNYHNVNSEVFEGFTGPGISSKQSEYQLSSEDATDIKRKYFQEKLAEAGYDINDLPG